MIQEEAFRCKSITEKLLDFSRCNDIKRERTELAGLIQGVVDMIRHIGKYTGKSIVFQPREAVMAYVDHQEIKQVVLNLIVNALESMDTERDPAHRGAVQPGDGRDGLHRQWLWHERRGARKHFRAVLYQDGAMAREPAWGSRSRIGSSTSTMARSWPRAREKNRARHSRCGCRSIRPRIDEDGADSSKNRTSAVVTRPAPAAIV